MYKLLIVDDEYAVVDSMKEIFLLQSEMQLEVYTAHSAEEALTIQKEKSVDVVMVDICMPDMDGIQLAQVLAKRAVGTKVIFLTAYDSFEYAKAAVGSNVVDYVLKLEGEERIIDAVKKAITVLKQEESIQGIVNRMTHRISSVLALYIREFLNVQIVSSGHTEEEIRRFFDETKLNFSYSRPVRMIVATASSTVSAEEFILAGNEIVKKYCADVREIAGTKTWGYYVWVLECSSSDTHDLKTACRVLQRSIEEDCNAEISFLISNGAIRWNELASKFDEMCFVLGKNSIGGAVIDDYGNQKSQGEFSEENFDYGAVKNAAEMMRFSLEELNEARTLKRLNEIKKEFSQNISMHYLPAVEVYLTVCQNIVNFVNKFGLAESIPFYTGLGKMLERENFDDWTMLWEYVVNVVVSMFECNKYRQSNKIENYIIKSKQYVAENLATVSLSEVADVLETSPSYLSRIFKEQEGIGFHEYITNKRLDNARDLLLTTDMKIYDIALKVGYDTNAYFAKVFRKVYGMNPNEYRELYYIKKN